MEGMLIGILQGLGLDPNELKAKAEEFISTVKNIDNRIKNIEHALGLPIETNAPTLKTVINEDAPTESHCEN